LAALPVAELLNTSTPYAARPAGSNGDSGNASAPGSLAPYGASFAGGPVLDGSKRTASKKLDDTDPEDKNSTESTVSGTPVTDGIGQGDDNQEVCGDGPLTEPDGWQRVAPHKKHVHINDKLNPISVHMAGGKLTYKTFHMF
jgi:hypothetical protein